VQFPFAPLGLKAMHSGRQEAMVSTDFDNFIAKYIDNYLFDDLETIHEIKKLKGNGAYLYIFGVCSGMEFLGALVRADSPINRERGLERVDTSNALAHYIKNYLIPVVDEQYKEGYQVFQRISPALIRNGLAHSCAPKGPIAVGRYNHAYKHLEFQQINGVRQLFINADTLYEDFKKSYQVLKLSIQDGGTLHDRAQQHYEEIRAVYRNEVSGLLSLDQEQ
jgi:hypothetical protein